MTTAKHKIKFSSGRLAKKESVEKPVQAVSTTRLPRVTKMMALAIRFDHLIKTGQVKDQAELARLAHVSRARLTQIMDLMLLAPEIQEAIFEFEPITDSLPRFREGIVRQIAIVPNWEKQRVLWKRLMERTAIS